MICIPVCPTPQHRLDEQPFPPQRDETADVKVPRVQGPQAHQALPPAHPDPRSASLVASAEQRARAARANTLDPRQSLYSFDGTP